MPLDPEAQRIIDRIPAEDPNGGAPPDPAAMREAFRAMWVTPEELLTPCGLGRGHRDPRPG